MPNLPLFDRWAKTGDVGAPYQPSSDTSREAAESVSRRIEQQRGDVYLCIIRGGSDGRIWDEIVEILDCSPTSNGRLTELKDMKLIEDSGRKRKTRRGCNATVYVATKLKGEVQR